MLQQLSESLGVIDAPLTGFIDLVSRRYRPQAHLLSLPVVRVLCRLRLLFGVATKLVSIGVNSDR